MIDPVETPRLVLEPLRVDHADEMVSVLADETLYLFTGGQPPTLAELQARYEFQSRGRSPDGSEEWMNWIVRAALVAWLAVRGVTGITAHIHPDHAASAAVAARLGLSPTDEVDDGEVVSLR